MNVSCHSMLMESCESMYHVIPCSPDVDFPWNVLPEMYPDTIQNSSELFQILYVSLNSQESTY